MNKPNNNAFIHTDIAKMVQIAENQVSALGLNMNRILQKELEQFRKLAELNFSGTAKELASAAQMVNEVTSSRINRDLASNLTKQHREFSKHIGSIIENNASLMDAAKIARIQSSFAVLEEIQNIPFEEIYKDEYKEIKEDNLQKSEDDDFFLKLFLYFRQKIEASQGGRIPVMKIATLAVSCLLFYISYQQYQLSLKIANEANKDRKESIRIQKKTNNKIEEFTNKLSPLLKDLEESGEDEFIVSTKRDCPIRSEPNSESDTLTRAFTGQEVEVIDSLKRWYQIKFFNATDTTIKNGFIYKGHVK